MAIAILENREPLISLATVAKTHEIHTATITRWIQTGARSATGKRVHLEGVRKGWKWFVSEAAVTRFFERLSDVSPTQEPLRKPVAERRREVEAAEKAMVAAGA